MASAGKSDAQQGAGLFSQATSGQLARVSISVGELLSQIRHWDQSLRSATNPIVTRCLEAPVPWAFGYELPALTHAVLLFQLMGESDRLTALGEVPDKLETVLDWMESEPPAPSFIEHADETTKDKVATLLSLLQAFSYSVESLATYGHTINALVARVAKGDDSAFSKAASIDPTSVAAPTMATRLSRAVMLNQRKFLKSYRSVLKGPHVNRSLYKPLRLMHAMMLDADVEAVRSMTDETRYKLFVEHLKLYPHDLSDSARALSTLFAKWEKEATN